MPKCYISFTGPGGVQAPFVTVLSSTSIQISWEPPIQPNGELDYYIIKLPSPRFEIRNASQQSLNVEDLVPNTVYYVTVTACTRSKIRNILSGNLSIDNEKNQIEESNKILSTTDILFITIT